MLEKAKSHNEVIKWKIMKPHYFFL
jgi:hypothetical protein